MKSIKIPWYSLKSLELYLITLNPLKYWSTYEWNQLIYNEIPKNPMKSPKSINPMKSHKIPLMPLKNLELPWTTLNYIELPYITLNYLELSWINLNYLEILYKVPYIHLPDWQSDRVTEWQGGSLRCLRI